MHITKDSKIHRIEEWQAAVPKMRWQIKKKRTRWPQISGTGIHLQITGKFPDHVKWSRSYRLLIC